MTDGNASRSQALAGLGAAWFLPSVQLRWDGRSAGFWCRTPEEMTGSGCWLIAASHRGETESTGTSVVRRPIGAAGRQPQDQQRAILSSHTVFVFVLGRLFASLCYNKPVPSQAKPAGATLTL